MFAFGSGGAVLSPAVKRRMREALPHVMVMDGFGSTETGVAGTDRAGGRRQGHRGGVLDGRQHRSARRRVRRSRRAPTRSASGPARARPLGYYNDPAKTAETFVEVDGVRWVLPGDLASVEADGAIRLHGRGSASINTGGEKVFPEEVESALMAHAAVQDVLVVGVPDDRWGERSPRWCNRWSVLTSGACRPRRSLQGVIMGVATRPPKRPGGRPPPRALAVGQGRLPLGTRGRGEAVGAPLAGARHGAQRSRRPQQPGEDVVELGARRGRRRDQDQSVLRVVLQSPPPVGQGHAPLVEQRDRPGPLAVVDAHGGRVAAPSRGPRCPAAPSGRGSSTATPAPSAVAGARRRRGRASG